MAKTTTQDLQLQYGTVHITCYHGKLQYTVLTYYWDYNGIQLSMSIKKPLSKYRCGTPEWNQQILDLACELERTIQIYFNLGLF